MWRRVHHPPAAGCDEAAVRPCAERLDLSLHDPVDLEGEGSDRKCEERWIDVDSYFRPGVIELNNNIRKGPNTADLEVKGFDSISVGCGFLDRRLILY